MSGGASLTRPTKPQFVGRVRRIRHPAISAFILQKAHRFIREIRKQPVHIRLVIQHAVKLIHVRRILRQLVCAYGIRMHLHLARMRLFHHRRQLDVTRR